MKTTKSVLEVIRNNEDTFTNFEITNELEIEQCLTANGRIIKFLSPQTDRQKSLAIESSPWSLEYVEEPNQALIEKAIRDEPLVIEFVKNPSEAQQLIAVSIWPPAFHKIKGRIFSSTYILAALHNQLDLLQTEEANKQENFTEQLLICLSSQFLKRNFDNLFESISRSQNKSLLQQLIQLDVKIGDYLKETHPLLVDKL